MEKRKLMLAILTLCATIQVAHSSSELNSNQYQHIFNFSRAKVQTLLHKLKPYRSQSMDTQVAYLAEALADVPYLYRGGVGEGDWQPNSPIYRVGALHISQYPVYRLDGFDCQSFVQVILGLLNSKNLNQFDQSIVNIAYGAAGNPAGNIVRYYNRNNFIDGDFNPINHRNGFLVDSTESGALSSYAQIATATITRQNWFNKQTNAVNVLNPNDENEMQARYTTIYSHLNYPYFNSQKVTVTYIPKQVLTGRSNQKVMDAIATPAVLEIVRDPKRWWIGDKKLVTILGTEMNVSHLGIIYRQTFPAGELIYRKIVCHHANCEVTPISCQQKSCTVLMFAHATDAHPSGYYWYQRGNGDFTCTPEPPQPGVKFSYCNRIERLPFMAYLTESQHGWYMRDPSYLGIHLEKITQQPSRGHA